MDAKTVAREVEDVHNQCGLTYLELKKSPTAYYSPMVVSKLLVILKEVKGTLEKLQGLPMKQQEEFAWLALNGCKLIFDVAQPLIWFNCGKYVVETLMFAAISLESIINLCTIRHVQFRMKLYTSIFYATITLGSTDEALAIWDHCQRQIMDLKERELLDPPLPSDSIDGLKRISEDLFVLKYVLDVWRDNDSMDFTPKLTDKYVSSVKDMVKDVDKDYFLDNDIYRFRILSEVVRVHHLGSGNMNETYIKRSHSIMKAVGVVIPTIDATKLSNELVMSIYEMAALSILDNSDTSVEIISQMKTLVQQLSSDTNPDGNFTERLQFLLQVSDVFSSAEASMESVKFSEEISRFCSNVHRMMFVDAAYHTKAFFAKFAAAFVRRVLYTPLQKYLSSVTPVSNKELENIGLGLTFVVKNLESVFAQDSIFYGTLAALNINVLCTVGDFRGAISVARRAVNIIEDHRAARTDFYAMLPEDVRDIMALQRQSFTTRSDSNDWYHSVKRLGAHAFAGFGIFGLGSSADRSDQALAEIHTELLSLYFRVELHYGISHYILRRSLLLKNKEIERAKAQALKENPNLPKKKKTEISKLNATGAQATTALNTSIDLSCGDTGAVSVEKLPIFNSLKIFCAKNQYAVAVLMIEAAKCESDVHQRSSFLQEAFTSLSQVEEQESHLTSHFQDYVLMTHQDRKHPIVLSRSHKYIYVAPVGCRKLKTVVYYKVHAKEKGSGTEVSIYNTDLPGSSRRVPVSALQNFKDCVVRVGPLRNGELYMFGTVGYTAADTVVGGVSPNTMVVEAVNPLPTVLLWSLLGQTAQSLQVTRLSLDASWKVCCRYFQSMPTREPFALTSGRNLFEYEEPGLCALALQQATSVLIHHFLASLLRYETQHLQTALFGPLAHWQYRQQAQLRYLTSFERLTTVVPLTSSLDSQDLLIQIALLCDNILQELLRYDILHLAKRLQHGLSALVMALQKVPKRQWHTAEHRLYYKLIAGLIQLGIMNRNMAPVVALLKEFFPEAREKTINPLVYPDAALLPELDALCKYAEAVLGDSIKTPLLNDARLLIASEQYKAEVDAAEGISDFWRSPTALRTSKLIAKAKDLANAAVPATAPEQQQEIEKALLQELPRQYSDYLTSIAQLMRELQAADDYEGIFKLVQRFPICTEYLATTLQEQHARWSLLSSEHVFVPLAKWNELKTQAAQAAAAPVAAAGKKAPPAKKGAPVVAAPEPDPATLIDLNKVPDRFLSPSDQEVQQQALKLAEIVSMLATIHEKTRGAVNIFVKSHRGPRQLIEPNQGSILHEPTDALVLSPASSQPVMTPEEVVKLSGAAVAFFTTAQCPEAAINALLCLWNYILAEYIDPQHFVTTFPALLPYMQLVLQAVTSVVEQIALVSTSSPSGLVSVEGSTVSEAGVVYQQKDMALMFTSLLQPLLYVVKVNWLSREYPEEVVQTCSRLFQVFVATVPPTSYLPPSTSDTTTLSASVLKTFCIEVWVLVVEAQETLIKNATTALETAQKAVSDYVNDYEEAQRKKRKKKLRIARTEKDEEELLFEAEKGKLEDVVASAQSKLAEREAELTEVKLKETYFNHEVLSKPAHATLVVKDQLFHFMSFLGQHFGTSYDWRRLLLPPHELIHNHAQTMTEESRALHLEALTRFTELRRAFEKAACLLRERKARLLLVDVLEDYTNVLLRFGLIEDAQQYLHDVADGLFNTMDACQHWKDVMTSALAGGFDLQLVPGLPYVMTALGKLSRYCAVQDYDRRAGYARMNVEIAMLLFQESYGHPVTKTGYACYECYVLGGHMSLPSQLLQGIFQTLEEHITVLDSEGAFLDTLPLIVLGEHIAATYLQNPRLWLDMRIHRIRSLVKLRYFAEAMSMLAGIPTTVKTLSKHQYGDQLRVTKSAETQDLSVFDRSRNDLVYFGQPALFCNNLLPQEETINAKALEWLNNQCARDLESFLSAYRVLVPESELSPAQREALEAERKAKAEAEAAAVASKKGGNKGKAPAAPAAMEGSSAEGGSSLPIFPMTQIVQLYVLTGQLFAELASVDGHQAAKHAVHTEKYATTSLSLLQKAKEYLFSRFPIADQGEDVHQLFLRLIASPPSDHDHAASSESKANEHDKEQLQTLYAHSFLHYMRSDRAWIRCYRECFVAEHRVYLMRRKYREVLAAVTRLQQLFAHRLFQTFAAGDQQYEVMQLWFQAKSLQLSALEGQGNRRALLQCLDASVWPCVRAMTAGYWLRAFRMVQAQTHALYNELPEALAAIDIVLHSYDASQQLEDTGLVQALVLRASLLKQQVQNRTGSEYVQVVQRHVHIHVEILTLLRRATDVAQRLGVRAGMFVPDTNVTYQLQSLDFQHEVDNGVKETYQGNVKGYHLLSPALQAFTSIHDNSPPLTITAAQGNEAEHHHLRHTVQSSHQRLRLGPVDTPGTDAATNLGAFVSVHPANVAINIYLYESRVLLQAQVALLQTLDDIRHLGLHRLSKIPAKSKFGSVSSLAKKKEDDDDEPGPFEPAILQLEEVHLVEYLLKLLRQVIYVSPATRASVYYYTARARMSANSGLAPVVSSGNDHNKDNATEQSLATTAQETQPAAVVNPALQVLTPTNMATHLTPIVAAFEVLCQSQATWTWSLLKRLALEVVRYYGHSNVVASLEDFNGQHNHSGREIDRASLLRQAASYLLLAAQVSRQRERVLRGVVDITSQAPEWQTALASETTLASLLAQCFTSSMSIPPPVVEDPDVAAANAAALAAAANSKDKKAAGGKGAAPVAAVGPTPTGRDALALLSTLLRETTEGGDQSHGGRGLMMDTITNSGVVSVVHDLHVLLQSSLPPSTYTALCALKPEQLPVGMLYPLFFAAMVSSNGGSSAPSLAALPPSAQVIAQGAVCSVWENDVASPESWVAMHSDIVTNKVFTVDAVYGLHSHAACYFLLGDAVTQVNPAEAAALAAAAAAAPPVKGKAAAPAKGSDPKGAAAAGASTGDLAADSTQPVLTRVVLYKGDVDRCERLLRQLAYDIQQPRDPSSKGRPAYPAPSVPYFASLVYAVHCLLQQGYLAEDFWTLVHLDGENHQSSATSSETTATTATFWTPETLIIYPPRSDATTTATATATTVTGTVIQLRRPDCHVQVTCTPAWLQHVADVLRRELDTSSVLTPTQCVPEVCTFLRNALGYAPAVVSARK